MIKHENIIKKDNLEIDGIKVMYSKIKLCFKIKKIAYNFLNFCEIFCKIWNTFEVLMCKTLMPVVYLK